MTELPPFIRWNDIQLNVCITFSLSRHLLLDIWVTSTFWLLWIVLQGTWICKFLFEILLSVLLGKYAEAGLLNHTADFNLTITLVTECKTNFTWDQYLRQRDRLNLGKISVQFSCSVLSNSLRRHGLQHARPSCSSPTTRVYPNSCPLSWWCHPAISSSIVPFSSCF